MNLPIPLITRQQVIGFLPARPDDSHKGLFGTVAIIGGASGMVGAALLAARAALKLGAGCVHVGLLARNMPSVDLLQPELMLDDAPTVLKLPKTTVMVVGCGMGSNLTAQPFLLAALRSQFTLVLDADALNILALRDDLRELLTSRTAPTLLTPHPGEAARLLECSTADVQADRIAAVTRLSKQFACPVVLKGANSLCALNNGELFLNNTGNPGMSGPGMGDTLAGIIAAFIAQGLSIDQALLLAVHLHGAAGDELAKQHTIGMTASEVTDMARRLLNDWMAEKRD